MTAASDIYIDIYIDIDMIYIITNKTYQLYIIRCNLFGNRGRDTAKTS